MSDDDLDSMTIQQLAYWFWQQRGSPDGSPDDDWRCAESARHYDRTAERQPPYALGIERPAP